MELKQGKIRSLHQASLTGIISGEGNSIVIFDRHDLGAAPFVDLKLETEVQYCDAEVPGEPFRTAILVVAGRAMPSQNLNSKRQGVVICWNEIFRIGVLIDKTDSISSFFPESAFEDASFDNEAPRPETEVEYVFRSVQGRRIATSLVPTSNASSTLGVARSAIVNDWPQGKVDSVNPISGRGLIIADTPSGRQISFTKASTEGSPIKFELLEGRRVEYQLRNSITAQVVRSV